LDCALISRDDTFRRQVTEWVGHAESNARLVLDIAASADRLPREAVSQILESRARLVLVDLGDSTTGIRVVQALREEGPDLAILATGPSLPADALLEMMRAGASEYLPRPLSDEDVAEAFRRLRKRVAAPSQDADVQGRVITVFSSKGGAGVTTVAANLATLVANRTHERTLLLDLNPGFGTAEVSLGLTPRYSYLDVMKNFHRMDAELLDSYLEEHETGMAFLGAPPVEESEPPTAAAVQELLRLCRRYFHNVVVDGGSRLHDALVYALRDSDELLLVATPEIATLRNLKRAQNHLAVRGLGGAPPAKVVLNQVREGTGVTDREVREVLGAAVFASIERDDAAVQQSMNVGNPLGESGRSRFARGIARLGDGLLGTNGRRGGGRLSFLKPFRSSTHGK
jgi:pilus assembly protein CpaE